MPIAVNAHHHRSSKKPCVREAPGSCLILFSLWGMFQLVQMFLNKRACWADSQGMSQESITPEQQDQKEHKVCYHCHHEVRFSLTFPCHLHAGVTNRGLGHTVTPQITSAMSQASDDTLKTLQKRKNRLQINQWTPGQCATSGYFTTSIPWLRTLSWLNLLWCKTSNHG